MSPEELAERELRKAWARAEAAELGCEIAYRREPTQAEGDAFEHQHDQSMGPSHPSGECFVPMGGWTGRRCRVCQRWTWGGPTACASCVTTDAAEKRVAELEQQLRAVREGADDLRAQLSAAPAAKLREALVDLLRQDPSLC